MRVPSRVRSATGPMLCIALAACAAGCARSSGAAQPSDPPSATAAGDARISTARITRAAIARTVTAYGSVQGGANAQASLAFAVAGRIESVAVQVGQTVRAGDVLARLDPAPFQNEISGARADVAAARAGLAKVALGARPQQADATRAQIAAAATERSLARAQVEREEHLVAGGVASHADLEAARARYATAASELTVLQQQLAAQKHPWQPDIDAARATVAQAEAALAAAQQKLGAARIVAPFDGVVAARLHNDGEIVDPSTPVVGLANAAPPVFTAQFTPADAVRIRAGEDATVTLQGSPRSLDGRVVARNPVQTDARTVPILIRLRAGDTAAGAGAYGVASIAVGRESGLIVPSASIVSDAATGATLIFRKDGDHFTPVPVDVVDRAGGRVLVTGAGLRAGQTVAAEGAYELLVPQQAPNKDNG